MCVARNGHVLFKGKLKEDGKFTGRDSISEIVAGLRQEKIKNGIFYRKGENG